jgi:type I restriction enzyme S subunit
MSEWKECKLIEVSKHFAMGPFGSNIKAENFVDSGVPVIRGTNMNTYKYVGGHFVFLTEDKADQLKSSNCFPGDLVFTHRGTLGQVGVIPDIEYPRYVISQSGMKVTINPDLVDTEFLFYFFKSEIGQHELLQHESQVGVPSISNPLTSLKSVKILLPPLAEQKAIAGVLSALDDKIDLLHRQNKTLEAMAEALFRQWFVEEAEESDQQIVKGEEWLELPLSSIANFLNGLACQKYPPTSVMDSLPVLKIKELNSGLNESSDRASKAIPKEYIVNDGDLIFSWSATLMVKIWTGGQCILNQHLFKVTSESYPKWFVYFWCKEHLKEFQSIAQTHATTMGHIKRSDLDKAMVLCPDRQTLTILDSEIDPLMAKFVSNQIQIRSLEKLRDTLLPKLMSGEVRVNE